MYIRSRCKGITLDGEEGKLIWIYGIMLVIPSLEVVVDIDRNSHAIIFGTKTIKTTWNSLSQRCKEDTDKRLRPRTRRF